MPSVDVGQEVGKLERLCNLLAEAETETEAIELAVSVLVLMLLHLLHKEIERRVFEGVAVLDGSAGAGHHISGHEVVVHHVPRGKVGKVHRLAVDRDQIHIRCRSGPGNSSKWVISLQGYAQNIAGPLGLS